MDRISDERLAELVRWHEQEAPYGLLDEAWRDAGSAMRELTALRRPVEQSAEIEEIRAGKFMPRYKPEIGCAMRECEDGQYVLHIHVEWRLHKLFDALDAAQRDLRKLGQANQNLSNRCATLGEEISCAGITADKLQAEIARLSSPPPERADIQERQAIRKAWIDGKDGANLGSAHTIGSIVDDFDTLLQDLARARNARHVYQAERELHQARKAEIDRLMADNAEYCKRHLAQLQRIERLERENIDLKCFDEGQQQTIAEQGQRIANLKTAADYLREVGGSAIARIERLEGALRLLMNCPGKSAEMRAGKPTETWFVALEKVEQARAALAASDEPALASSQHTAGSGDGVVGE